MKSDRELSFRNTLIAVLIASAVLLGVLLMFGERIAAVNTTVLLIPVFAFFAGAAISFLLFCFLPYFRNDRRWYVISGILTVVFLIGSAILWSVAPVTAPGGSV